VLKDQKWRKEVSAVRLDGEHFSYYFLVFASW